MAEPVRDVIGGVDTHGEVHVAAVVDTVGRILDTADFPTTPAGYRRLLSWMRRHGVVVRVGVEGTGAWGAGLARYLVSEGIEVVEVDRPNRQLRRTEASPTPSMPKPPLGLPSTAKPPARPRPRPGRWSASEPCG